MIPSICNKTILTTLHSSIPISAVRLCHTSTNETSKKADEQRDKIFGVDLCKECAAKLNNEYPRIEREFKQDMEDLLTRVIRRRTMLAGLCFFLGNYLGRLSASNRR